MTSFRLRALENATGIDADLTICMRNVGSVAHQAAGFGILTLCIDCGNCMARRQVGQLDAPAGEYGVAADEDGVGPLAHKSCEGRVDLAAGAGFLLLGGKLNFRVSSRDLSSEEPMSRRLLIIASMLLFSICASPAQTPSPDAMMAARSLVTTMKLSDQYKALLPAILLTLRPALTQDRPEIERDYDAMMPMIVDAFTPYYNAMVDDIATVYANNFTAGELREIEAFYRQPVGQKFLEKGQAITQQSMQVGQDVSRKAADDLRTRLTEALRQKGHKL
jgi:hypothetical protein